MVVFKVVSFGPYINPSTGAQQKTKVFNRKLRIPPTVLELDEMNRIDEEEEEEVTMVEENSGSQITGDDDDFQAVVIKDEEGQDDLDEEMDGEVFNAMTTLQSEAKKYGVPIEWEFKEVDSGIQTRPVVIHCDVKAGIFKASGQSISKAMAKEIAAGELLKELSGTKKIPFKTVPTTLDEMNDPIHLLDLYCKSRQFSTPTYNHMGLQIGDETEKHLYLCIIRKTVKEGRSRNKEHAKRLAAFEMLNFLIENKKSEPTDKCPASNYASLDLETVNSIRNNPEHLESIKPTVKPFDVSTQKLSGPGEPSELITRYFYNTEKKGNPNFRHMVQVFAKFEGMSEDSIDEARGMSISDAKNFIPNVPKYFQNATPPSVPLTESNQ